MLRRIMVVLPMLGVVGVLLFVPRVGLTYQRWWVNYRPNRYERVALTADTGDVRFRIRWRTSRFVDPKDHNWHCVRRGRGLRVDASAYWIDEVKFSSISITAPLWTASVPFAVFAAYPTVAFMRGPVRRWRRRRKGWCLSCGYDLTGNVSGVCPECGTEVKQP